MDWPFIENTNNFIVDYHIVYAVVCVYLIAPPHPGLGALVGVPRYPVNSFPSW
jgi:hypothetical protein